MGRERPKQFRSARSVVTRGSSVARGSSSIGSRALPHPLKPVKNKRGNVGPDRKSTAGLNTALQKPAYTIFYPPIISRHADGSTVVRPGKPAVKEFLTVRDASKVLGLSTRRIQFLCKTRKFTAKQPSGPKGMYLIPVSEVIRIRGLDGGE